ncbi:MAG: cell division protein FtsA [Bacteroidota bacterium]|jgi:cell division protein FtsA|nr:cell division protein FtsA [Bacteroidota bacterium]
MKNRYQNASLAENIVVGLDIGTTKVCAMIAAKDADDHINILGIGKAENEGMARGTVTHIDKTVRAIQQAVVDAERQSGIKVRAVNVGIAGDHIQSFQSRGVIAISNPENEIARKDVERLLQDTKRVALPSDRRIIHVIPQEFIVDGQDGIYDPVGMAGVRMEANVHIITGGISAVQNIYKCVERAGLEVNDLVLEPLASANAVINDEEKEVGIVLVDIGGGTTDIAIFEERTIRHSAVLAIAGKKVTEDIRKGLGILNEQAEKLKREHGYAYLPEIVDDTPIVLPRLGSRDEMQISRSLLCQIIQPRMEEILEIVALEIKRSGYSKHLHSGVIITGGGSLIKGTAALAREVLGMPVKIGIPAGFAGGFVNEVENPIYSTCTGLVLHGMKSIGSPSFDTRATEGKTNIVRKIIEWFNEL